MLGNPPNDHRFLTDTCPRVHYRFGGVGDGGKKKGRSQAASRFFEIPGGSPPEGLLSL
jgi:hypothetical protein